MLEEQHYRDFAIPQDEIGQKRLLRGLFNVRPPMPADPGFLAVQDAYLKEAIREKGVSAAFFCMRSIAVDEGIVDFQSTETLMRDLAHRSA